jgi:hypothetical protein
MMLLLCEQMNVELNNHILLHFDRYLRIVVNKNFLVELIDEVEEMYEVDEHDNVLNVVKANMMVLMNRLMNE